MADDRQPDDSGIAPSRHACLPLVGHSETGAVVCVLGFGLGFGVATIARPAVLADRYGTTAYAIVASILALHRCRPRHRRIVPGGPGIAVIGGDGGREQLALDLRHEPAPVLPVDITSSGWHDAIEQPTT